ncbi:MAG: 2-dehydro-3-deoxygalactonokinase, partial [Bacillota bacterium]
MAGIAVVDSGTTNTRVRLWDGHRVVASASEAVGAAATAADGHTGRLRAALKRLIEQVAAEGGLEPGAVLCSGMITANVGLLEVPHAPAPAGVGDLARQAGVAVCCGALTPTEIAEARELGSTPRLVPGGAHQPDGLAGIGRPGVSGGR